MELAGDQGQPGTRIEKNIGMKGWRLEKYDKMGKT